MTDSGRISLPSPDVVIRRTRFTRAGKPIRLFGLCTHAAEEWASTHAARTPRLARSLIVQKIDVPTTQAAMEKDGLIVRALSNGFDPTQIVERS